MTLAGVPQWIILPWLFILGACVGSFLNVCIYRIPRQERLWDQLSGLTNPPSSCPFCRHRILSIDNIPLFGWLFLRGRCRFCRHAIPTRYALIEFFNGLLWVLIYVLIVPAGYQTTVQQSCLWSPLSPLADPALNFTQQVFLLHAQYLYYLIFIEALLVATFIDFDLYIIPDGSTLPAICVGLCGALVLGPLHLWPVWFQSPSTLSFFQQLVPDSVPWLLDGSEQPAWLKSHVHLHGLLSSVAGLVVGGGLVWLVRVIGQRVMHREAMGFGDVVLTAMIGSFLGWQPTVIVFFIAPLCALIGVVLTLFYKREREIAYGPYLSIAALLVLLLWRPWFSKSEQWFSLGPIVFVQGVVLFAMLALTLMLVQFLKRALGFRDPAPAIVDWTAGDQLAFFANKEDSVASILRQSSNWPGAASGQGRQFTDRWRSGAR